MTSGRRLVPAAGRPTAFWLVVYAFAVVMLGTTLPTPLYPLYEMTFGASPTVITTIFSTYAVGVIAALLLVGRLSDEIGRRPVLLPGLACSAASAVVFLLAHGVAEIYAGRILSGLSAGIFTGTATAAILDLAPDDRRGFATTVAVACNIFGLACGPLIAGVLAEWAPAPLRLPYAVDLVLLAPAVVGVLLAPETVRRRAGARLRLQRLNVPPQVRRIFWQAVVIGFMAFAVSGLFGSIAPGLMAGLLRVTSHAVAGLVVFLLFTCSAAAQLVTPRLPWRAGLGIGCAGLVAGVCLLAGALVLESLGLLIAAALGAGVGQGLGIGSGLAAVSARIDPSTRGEVASTYFVLLYVGLIIPVIGVGLASSAVGPRPAGLAFCAVVGAAVIAVAVSLWRGQREPGHAVAR